MSRGRELGVSERGIFLRGKEVLYVFMREVHEQLFEFQRSRVTMPEPQPRCPACFSRGNHLH